MIRKFSKILLFMSSVFQTFSKINRDFPKIQKKNRKYLTYFNKKFHNNPKKTNSKRTKQRSRFSQIKQDRNAHQPHRLRKGACPSFLTSINEDAPPQKESLPVHPFGHFCKQKSPILSHSPHAFGFW